MDKFSTEGEGSFLNRLSAVSKLTPVAPPKRVSSAAQAIPSYLTTATPNKDAALPKTDSRIANIDITDFRNAQTTQQVIRDLSKASPDLGAAISSGLRMGITDGYKIIARDLDGKLNPEATRLAQQLASRFDIVGDYESGISSIKSLRSNSESMGLELFRYGACSAELVLDKARLPYKIEPVSITKLEFRSDGKKKIPWQKAGSEAVSLDIPTFFYISLDQDLLDAYADSPVQASLQPILGAQEFLNDIRRIFKKAIHPRVKVAIDETLWRKSLPPDILHDTDKLSAYMATTIDNISTKLNGLNPEDALVYFNSLEIGYLVGGNNSLSDEYTTYNNIMNGKLASGMKTMPVVLGHDSTGSTNVASSQSMLHLKTVEGMIQGKLDEMYSRIFTLALRLFGLDVIASFTYNKINLRPHEELEAFKTMKQSRTLELLSLGFITDEEAAIELTGTLPNTIPALSGTMFFKANANTGDNPYSNVNEGALGQQTSPDTPTQSKGQN